MVIQIFLREQGIYLPKNNPKGINTIEDIVNKGATFINRSQGSGTRLLFDFLLFKKHIEPSAINGYHSEAESHLQVGLNVLKGNVDASFGIRHIAHILDLDFIPMFNERFDMVISKNHFYNAQVHNFLLFFEQPVLLTHIKDFTGYNITEIGSILNPDV